jgi:hypothetical protein
MLADIAATGLAEFYLTQEMRPDKRKLLAFQCNTIASPKQAGIAFSASESLRL